MFHVRGMMYIEKVMEKALIYIRVSTDEQAGDERHSLKTQTKLCERAIEDGKAFTLAENGIYIDPGKTATNMNRAGLQDMLLRVREDKSIRAIFVQDTDRLARNVNDHLMIKAILKKAGVKLISVSQPGMEDTPEGNFMDVVIAGVNQLQSQITSRKTVKSTDQKFNDGGWPTKAPIGYRNAGHPDDEKIRIIVTDPLRAPLVAETFEMYATGDYSIIEVRDAMYKKGLITVAGKMLASSKMFEMLRCHFYYGEMHWRGKIKTGGHEAIINKELFDRCQRVIAEHNRYACRKRKYSFLLNGFVFCSICGQRYTAEHHFAKKKSYYHCKRKSDRMKCTDKYVETWDLEKQVQTEFDKLQFSPDFINKIVEKVKVIYEEKKSGISVEKKRFVSTKLNLEKKLGIAEEKLLSGTLADDAFTRIKNQIREQIDHIDDEIYKVEKSKNLKVDVIQELLGLIKNIGKAYNKAPLQLKRLYLGLFWEEFTASNKLIVEAKKAPVVIALEEIGAMLTKSKEIQKPVLTERAFVSDPYLSADAVRIRMVRGG
jgi:DNA invertase Pin-like site-specific DNA recombinase